METLGITAVSQLITQGRVRHGPLTAVEVPTELWEQVMDEVAAAGGAVGFDHCMVDGVQVRRLEDEGAATAFVPVSGERETLEH